MEKTGPIFEGLGGGETYLTEISDSLKRIAEALSSIDRRLEEFSGERFIDVTQPRLGTEKYLRVRDTVGNRPSGQS